MLQAAYNRGDTFQSVYVKLVSPGAFQEFKDALTTDPRLNVKVLRQTEYYAEQSTAVNRLINTLGYLIASLMAIGAVFGALNTMYSSVSARTREIATLRALGFGSGAVVVSVMIESLALAVVGGALGAVLAYFTFNGLHTSTMNWNSFSQVTFAFAVTPGPARARDRVGRPHRSDRRPLPRPPRRPPAHRRRPARALMPGRLYWPLLGSKPASAETALESPATGTLTSHFAPGSSTGRKALATSTFWPPASSRSNSTVTCERRRSGRVHHRADRVKPVPALPLLQRDGRNLKARRHRRIFRPGRGRGSVSLLRRQLLEMLQPHHRHDQPRDQNPRRDDRPDDHLPRHGWFLRRGRQHQLGLLPAARACGHRADQFRLELDRPAALAADARQTLGPIHCPRQGYQKAGAPSLRSFSLARLICAGPAWQARRNLLP